MIASSRPAGESRWKSTGRRPSSSRGDSARPKHSWSLTRTIGCGTCPRPLPACSSWSVSATSSDSHCCGHRIRCEAPDGTASRCGASSSKREASGQGSSRRRAETVSIERTEAPRASAASSGPSQTCAWAPRESSSMAGQGSPRCRWQAAIRARSCSACSDISSSAGPCSSSARPIASAACSGSGRAGVAASSMAPSDSTSRALARPSTKRTDSSRRCSRPAARSAVARSSPAAARIRAPVPAAAEACERVTSATASHCSWTSGDSRGRPARVPEASSHCSPRSSIRRAIRSGKARPTTSPRTSWASAGA